MPIKWNALMVNEAMDMVEEYVNQAIEPLEQAKLVATEARKIPNLPGYCGRMDLMDTKTRYNIKIEVSHGKNTTRKVYQRVS